jgi:hypothetical protein
VNIPNRARFWRTATLGVSFRVGTKFPGLVGKASPDHHRIKHLAGGVNQGVVAGDLDVIVGNTTLVAGVLYRVQYIGAR